MSTADSASELASIALDIDLSATDANSDAAAIADAAAQPRRFPDVKDGGRILFGAACRMPLQK